MDKTSLDLRVELGIRSIGNKIQSLKKRSKENNTSVRNRAVNPEFFRLNSLIGIGSKFMC